ncbi:hypothetical protein EDB92DRAFT_487395 [Lactarius akahatsu]|uniref:Uncharacterized protein n=1 Tax=Lactarius akahatsu TaxID=416441 RepID=A0AAD4LUI6_9AGAM|nr:hypothetical protein EDB92DRAFT_487395 [Lactarius akahatsu]
MGTVDNYEHDGKGKYFGTKPEKFLVRKRIPSNRRVFIFVQFPDFMKKVAEALTANKVRFLEIKDRAAPKGKNMEKLQDETEERVVLLNVIDESASGTNLTSANRPIFRRCSRRHWRSTRRTRRGPSVASSVTGRRKPCSSDDSQA